MSAKLNRTGNGIKIMFPVKGKLHAIKYSKNEKHLFPNRNKKVYSIQFVNTQCAYNSYTSLSNEIYAKTTLYTLFFFFVFLLLSVFRSVSFLHTLFFIIFDTESGGQVQVKSSCVTFILH